MITVHLKDVLIHKTDLNCKCVGLSVPGPQGNDTGGDSHTTFYIMMAWMVIAFVLYLLR